MNIPKGVWHTLESLESGSVFFECKEGPFVAHEVDGILDLSQICRTLGMGRSAFLFVIGEYLSCFGL